MEAVVAEERIKRALRSKLPPTTKYQLSPGDLVRVYREVKRKWVGPVQIIRLQNKIFHVTDGIKVKAFNRVQVMPVLTNNHAEDAHIDTIFRHSDAQEAHEQYDRKCAEI